MEMMVALENIYFQATIDCEDHNKLWPGSFQRQGNNFLAP